MVVCHGAAPLEAALHELVGTPASGSLSERRMTAARFAGEDSRWGRVASSALGLSPGPADAAELAAFLSSRPSLPAVLVDWSAATPGEVDICSVTRACLEVPRLPLAVVVKDATLAKWLASSPSLTTTLLREGFAASESPRPEDEARSRAERVLFDTLEASAATRGAFHLNVNQPWLFGNREVEIDLYAPRWRLAIEVDGYHHFTTEDAYRRDRRKDLEYQLHDVTIIRVLADDVMVNVADVVDRVLRLVSRLEEKGT